MGRDSTQKKLSRVRPPRVHITYDVEVGGAMEIKELPFVLGVLGDFSGQPKQPLEALKLRKFVEIGPENFDKVLEGMKPRLAFSVKNKLSSDPNANDLKVDLQFSQMEDFEPEKIVEQVPPLNALLTLRSKLSDLRGSLQGNEELDKLLLEIANKTEKRSQLQGDIEKDKEKRKEDEKGGSNG